jgi:hypothetical protein
LLVLAGLFVWKNAVPFLPPYGTDAEPPPPDAVQGRDSAAGFTNLLRRNIPARDILGACLLEWKKTCAHQVPRARLEQVQAVIDAENARAEKERDAIHTYSAISQVLARGSEFRVPSSEFRVACPRKSCAYSRDRQKTLGKPYKTKPWQLSTDSKTLPPGRRPVRLPKRSTR